MNVKKISESTAEGYYIGKTQFDPVPPGLEPDYRWLEGLMKKYPIADDADYNRPDRNKVHSISPYEHPAIPGSGEYNLFASSLGEVDKVGIRNRKRKDAFSKSMHTLYGNGKIIVDPTLKRSGKDSFMDSNGIIHLNPDLFQETTFEQFIKTRDNISSLNIPQLEDLYKRFTTETNFRRRVQIAGALIESKFAGSRTVRNQFYKKLYNHYSSQNPRNWRLPIINELMQGSGKQSNKISKTMKSPVNKPVIAPSQKPSPGKTTKDYIYHNNMPITKKSWNNLLKKHGKKNLNWVLNLFNERLNTNPDFAHFKGKLPEKLLYPDKYKGRLVNWAIKSYATKKDSSAGCCITYARKILNNENKVDITFENHMAKQNFLVVHKEVRADDNKEDKDFGHYYYVVGIVDMLKMSESEIVKKTMKRKSIKSVWKLDKADIVELALQEGFFTWAESGENDPQSFGKTAHRPIKDYFQESGWFNMKDGKLPSGTQKRKLTDPKVVLPKKNEEKDRKNEKK